MTSCHRGVAARVKEVSHQDASSTHCIIHREHLVAKELSKELNIVLRNVVEIVNAIRANALNSRLFEALCDEMGSRFSHLLFHAEVRWLSRGRVLSRLFTLREEVRVFFVQQKNAKLLKFLTDKDWVAKLAYMADLFSLLNELSLSLQGPQDDMFSMLAKMDAFRRKIALWRTAIAREDFQMFPNFDDYFKENDVSTHVIQIIKDHLRCVEDSFDHYFPLSEDPRPGNIWILDPFTTNSDDTNLDLREKENLIELSSDDGLKIRFKTSPSRSHFWLSVKSEYPALTHRAMKLLLQFSTTYLCEKTFSAMAAIKTKYRSSLEIEPALRVGVTNREPRTPVD